MHSVGWKKIVIVWLEVRVIFCWRDLCLDMLRLTEWEEIATKDEAVSPAKVRWDIFSHVSTMCSKKTNITFMFFIIL